MTLTLVTDMKKFEITDIKDGYNSLEKVGNFYKDMKLILGEPFFSSPKNLITISNTRRGCGYLLELFKGDVDVVSMELFSHWTGYAHESSINPYPDNQISHFIGLDITLSDEEKRIVDEILKLTKKYPSG